MASGIARGRVPTTKMAAILTGSAYHLNGICRGMFWTNGSDWAIPIAVSFAAVFWDVKQQKTAAKETIPIDPKFAYIRAGSLICCAVSRLADDQMISLEMKGTS